MPSALLEFTRTSLLIFGALFPIVNPLGNAPIFLSLTRDLSSATRNILSRKIALNGLALLIASIFIGTNILAFFGISIPVVQVGGGLVVLATGWKLLNRIDEDPPVKSDHPANSHDLSQRAFYPLTLPLTVGPGSMSVAIAVGANRPQGLEMNWPVLAATVAGAAMVSICIYLSYRFAENIARLLGETAMSVVLRLSSFILLCIGVQIASNGATALLRSALVK
jgi:multiple antibiotic resistance protein